MSFVMNLVLVAQILSALGMVGLILVQHGKGADMGAAFGSGSSGSLFGASGSANFLSRSTAVLATVFLASTLLLSYYGCWPRRRGRRRWSRWSRPMLMDTGWRRCCRCCARCHAH